MILPGSLIPSHKYVLKNLTFVVRSHSCIYVTTLVKSFIFNDIAFLVTSLCGRVRHFQHLPCSGITGGVQLEGGPLFFNPSHVVALKQRLYGWLWYLQ